MMNNNLITHIPEAPACPDECGRAQVIRTLCLTPGALHTALKQQQQQQRKL